MGKKKPFIDKKAATKFRIAPRSQFDPLIADESAPQNVLVPADVTQQTIYREDVQQKNAENVSLSRKEEQLKYGIYFDDDYDYMKHLAAVGTDPDAVRIENKKQPEFVVDLPEDVLPSRTENETAMLNMGETGLNLEQNFEVMGQLDDFAEHEENWELADDFFSRANASDFEDAPEDEDDGYGDREGGSGNNGFLTKDGYQLKQRTYSNNYSDNDNDNDDCSSGGGYGSDMGNMSDFEDAFSDEETRSRFTEYSMSSSVMPRNDGLRFVDDRFEEFFEQYDEEKCGGLNEVEICGNQDINKLVNELSLGNIVKRAEIDVEPSKDITKDPIMQKYIVKCNEELDSDDEAAIRYEEEIRTEQWLKFEGPADKEEKWDAESILSTRSNVYNHPEVLKIPKKKNGSLKTVSFAENDIIKELEHIEEESVQDDDNDDDDDSESEYEERENKGIRRNKKETPEEKKARKKFLKDERKNRRTQKKNKKDAFKTEELFQEKARHQKRIHQPLTVRL